MRKLILVVLLSMLTNAAIAHGGYGYRYYGQGGVWGWLLPTIVGGIIGYQVANNQSRQQDPVVTQTTPVITQTQSNCGPWTEIQNPDGSITKTRTCTQ